MAGGKGPTKGFLAKYGPPITSAERLPPSTFCKNDVGWGPNTHRDSSCVSNYLVGGGGPQRTWVYRKVAGPKGQGA